MKITRVKCLAYEYPLTRPIGDANSVDEVGNILATRTGTDLAVFVETDEGITGVGIGVASAASQLPTVAKVVVGEDARSVRGLWHRMVSAAFKGGNQGTVALAIAAIDNALWDLRAKINGVPLWREFGATTNRARVYASGIDMPLSDSDLERYYKRMASQGITAGKLKVGLDVDEDMRRLAIMEDALGGRACRPTLLVDANEYWSPKQAIRRMSQIEQEFDITWCEEPVRRWDYRGLRQVSRSIRAAVATGENLKDISEFMPLIEHESVDVVQVNPATAGLTTCLRVADVAYAFDRPVALVNHAGRYAAHLAAALPHHIMMEVVDIGRDVVFSTDAKVENGWIVLGNAPGSGIEFDMAALSEHATRGRRRVPRMGEGSGRGHLAGVREGRTVMYRT